MERIVDLLQRAGDGAIAVDRCQRIVFCNRAFEKTFGCLASQVIGKPCYEVIGGSSVNGCLICRADCAIFQASRERQTVSPREVCVSRQDGTELWLNVSTLTVPSTWSELSVLVHLFTDITKYKLLESSLERLLKDYQASVDYGNADNEKPQLPEYDNQLSSRELEVLQVLGSGSTTEEIAERLSISTATTKNHIHHIISKLGVRNRLEAVTLAMRVGIVG